MKSAFVFALLVTCSFSLMASTTMTMNYGGIQRDFIVHLPTSYTAGQHLPLVFNFHGYTSSASQQELYSKMDNTADANNFIVVYPDGVANAWNVGWTGTYGTGVDDVGFVSAMIDTLHLLYSIDLTRVYSTGLSNGGFLSHRLACELENRIAAIAAVSGTLTDSTYFYCHPTRIMPIMHIHGTTDPIVPYSGVPGSLSTEQVVNFWLNKNTCATPGDTIDITNTSTADGSTAESINYPSCAGGTRILFYKITGGGHTWPNGFVDIPNFGNTNRDMDASTEIWNFFKQYSLSSNTGIATFGSNEVTVKVYPNPCSIEIKLDSDSRMEQVEVFNILGEQVFHSRINSDYATVNLSSMHTGIYLLKVVGNGFTHTERFFKN